METSSLLRAQSLAGGHPGCYLSSPLNCVPKKSSKVVKKDTKSEILLTTMDVKPTRWGTMIPLIGGSALGCQKVANILKKMKRKNEQKIADKGNI